MDDETRAALVAAGVAPKFDVTLSKRNLETLLAKLERADSMRMLIRQPEPGVVLTVTAEDNDEHYRDRPAGEVHPIEETQVSRPATGTECVDLGPWLEDDGFAELGGEG